MNRFLRAIAWLRSSVEGDDGKPSHRKLTTFTFVALIVYMVVVRLNSQIELNAFYALLVMIGVLIGIVTVDNVLRFFGRGGADKDEVMTGIKLPPTPPDPGLKKGDEIVSIVTDIQKP